MKQFFVSFACYFYHHHLLPINIFALNASKSVFIFPTNSCFINPITFFLFLLGNGFLTHNMNYQILFQNALQCLCTCLLFSCSLKSYLYSFTIVLFFLHFLVLRNHTESHTLLFHLVLILIQPNTIDYS